MSKKDFFKGAARKTKNLGGLFMGQNVFGTPDTQHLDTEKE